MVIAKLTLVSVRIQISVVSAHKKVEALLISRIIKCDIGWG